MIANDADGDYAEHNVERWGKIFNLTDTQAKGAIEAFLNDLSRLKISEEHWSEVREEMESHGHDKESYAYLLSKQQKRHSITKTTTEEETNTSKAETRKKFLFKLEYPLETAAKVQQVASLEKLPEEHVDENDDSLRFVVINSQARAAIAAYLAPSKPSFTQLRTSAEKELSSWSLASTLGIDATLPHNRIEDIPLPKQDQYPVLYFFYGTLAEPSRLVELLVLNEAPALHASQIRRGKIEMWGKYRALVDGGENDVVPGSAYLVQSKQHEEALMFFEGENYEVVRCNIELEDGRVVKGLTFRFCG
ncbi:hypothetical protein BS50DRAFT_491469 [Corynespora cassiicola Philippines]|uniref:Putative gamma-glutamylcyclotransferase n=1 Tax=Corynespora cassiicola Philippines TaxID=1448308 RepID=A0A2T2NS83_CORCC|nr:hypothetical protein BS50DRAFT_491469 [Corynespora cassiicola Philippines]